MPCNSDYMNPTAVEINSKRVATLIVYAHNQLGATTPAWIKTAAEAFYGDKDHLDLLTKNLCDICRKMTPQEQDAIIYNGHDAHARDLANWWEEHQAADKKREEREVHDAQVQAMAVAVGGVLSDEQKALLREAVKTGAL